MTSTGFRRVQAVVTVLLLTVSTALSAGSGYSGRVFLADGISPQSGVVVTLVDPHTERRWASAPTDRDGTFAIRSAPAGNYGLLADTPDGTFLAAAEVTVASGANRPVALTLKAGQPNFQAAPGPAAAAGAASGLPTWAAGVIAGVVGVGGLFLIDDLTDDTEDPASAF